MRIVKDTNIDFMSKSSLALALSAILLILGLISMVVNGGPKLSIDFKGGTLVAVNFTGPVDIDNIRSAMGNISINGQNFDFSKGEIKHFGDDSNVAIRIPSLDNEPTEFSSHIIDHLASMYPALVPELESEFILTTEKVGPKVGSELSSDAFFAILSAVGLILIYISIRFEFKFAMCKMDMDLF